MRIASYNIRKSVGLDWKRNPTRILDVLDEIQADIVVLQEADKRLGSRSGTLPEEELLERLDYHFIDNKMQKSHGWHGNAILYRPSLRVKSVDRIALPAFEPRGAVSVLFETNDNEIIRIIGTHLALLSNIRVKQANTILSYIQEQKTYHPTVIAGDFNEWTTKGPTYRIFSTNYQVITPGASFHSSRPTLALDRFVLSKDLSAKDYFVHDSTAAQRASDHLPIYLDL